MSHRRHCCQTPGSTTGSSPGFTAAGSGQPSQHRGSPPGSQFYRRFRPNAGPQTRAPSPHLLIPWFPFTQSTLRSTVGGVQGFGVGACRASYREEEEELGMEIGSFPSCSSQKLRAWGMKAQEMKGLATPASQSPGCGEELRASKVRGDMGYPWSGVGVNPASTQHSCIPSTWLQADPPVPLTPAPRASEEERRAAPAPVWVVPWAGCSPAGALSRSRVPAGQSPIEGLCCTGQGQQVWSEGGGPGL